MKKRILALLLAALLTLSLWACGVDMGDAAYPVGTVASGEGTESAPAQAPSRPEETEAIQEETQAPKLDEDGVYTTKEDVALYLWQYGHLPQNFITKKEAKDLGWPGGGLEDYAPGKCIGGDRFGNYEGALPELEGQSYFECDIDTLGAGSRGAKRLVFREDCQVIYYTEDHYETFEVVYSALPEGEALP